MSSKIIVEDKKDFSNCILNLINEKQIDITFTGNYIFVDSNDTNLITLTLQTITGMSNFIPEESINGISFRVDVKQFNAGLKMCMEDGEFKIMIINDICKIIQNDRISSFPIIKMLNYEEKNYSLRKSCVGFQVESNVLLYDSGILQINANRVFKVLKTILDSEEYNQLPPYYKIKANEDALSITKGDEHHFTSMILTDFNFSGTPSEVKINTHLEKIPKIFNPDGIVNIKCIDNTMIQFSQNVTMNTKIDFSIAGRCE